jgi:hypothetical protein
MAAYSPFYNSLEPRYITAGKAADIIGVTKRSPTTCSTAAV